MKLLVVVAGYRVTDLTIDCLRSLSAEIHHVLGARVAVCENGTGGDAACITGFGKRPVQNPLLLPGAAKKSA